MRLWAYCVSVRYPAKENAVYKSRSSLWPLFISALFLLPLSVTAQTTFGSVDMGSSATVTVTLPYGGGTLTSIAVLTQGAPGLDFTDAGGGTCVVGVSPMWCTVQVAFAPKFAGARSGAVVLTDASGGVSTVYLLGTGVGPQVAFPPYNAPPNLLPITQQGLPMGVAVDGGGNLYICDSDNLSSVGGSVTGTARVLKETLSDGTYTQSIIASGFFNPVNVAVDAAGNVYVFDLGYSAEHVTQGNAIYKLTPSNGGYTQSSIGTAYQFSAVDFAGNIYEVVSGTHSSDDGALIALYASTNYAQNIGGLPLPTLPDRYTPDRTDSVAVDGYGNVYFDFICTYNPLYGPRPSDYLLMAEDNVTTGASTLIYTLADDGYLTYLPGASPMWSDTFGNIYVDVEGIPASNTWFMEYNPTANGYVNSDWLSGLNVYRFPYSISVDSGGSLYIADTGGWTQQGYVTTGTGIYKLDYADPPTLTFGPTSVGVASNSAPITPIANFGSSPLTISSITYPPDFPPVIGTYSTPCTAGLTLNPQQGCYVIANFKPLRPLNGTTPVVITEAIEVTTNTQGNSGTTQSIPVTGTQVAPPPTVTTSIALKASKASTAFNQPVTFTATLSAFGSKQQPTGESLTFMTGPTQNGSPLSATTLLGSAPLSGGIATLTTSALPAATDVVIAVYAGDFTFIPSISPWILETVSKATTTTTMTASPNPSSTAQTVTLTATVTGQYGGAPSGIVTFKSGGAWLSQAYVSNGTASIQTQAIANGPTTTAAYAGDASFSASTSKVWTQKVNPEATTTTLATSQTPTAYGQGVTFMATVTAQYGGTPGGTVTFTSGSKSLGTAQVFGSGGIYTTTLPIGTTSVIATYSGNNLFAASKSAAVSQVVGKSASAASLATSPNPSSFGKPVTLTAYLTGQYGGTPTGTVTFNNGTTKLGTGALSGGKATLATTALPAGASSVTVTYGGDANFTAGSSAPLSQTVSPSSTTTTLVSSKTPSSFGQSVTFTASVAGQSTAAATGSVTFNSGTTALGTANLSSGKASLATTALAVGTASITAAYTGDSNYTASTSKALTQVIGKATTTTALTASPNPSTAGQSVTFTAAVAGQYGGIATGTVTFKNGTATLGTGSLTAGKASYSTPALPVATNSITAVYSGDSNFTASTSKAVSQVVKK